MSTCDPAVLTTSILATIGQWLPRGWTWKKSALGPLQTLMTVIHMTALGAKGYRAGMRAVFDAMHRAFGWEGDSPTPSALTQARGKLTEKMCRDLFRRMAQEATHVASHARLSYRDFTRIVAADGTKVPLVSTAGLKRDFGCPAGDHLAPQALLTLLWDVGGNVPVDWRLGPHDGSEQVDLADMLGSLGAGDLLLADRLYPSRSLMAQLHRRGIHFVMRLKSEGTRIAQETKDFIASEEPDLVQPLMGHPGQSVRIVRGTKPGTEHLIFVTSLLDEEHTPQAIADLYQRRWAIETAYREAKSWHALEELPGKSKQMVRQEVCALMLFWLMQGELEGQARRTYAKEIKAQRAIDKKFRPAEGITEVPVLFSRPLAALSVALLMAAAVTGLPEAVESWTVSIRYLWKTRSRRRPGRTFRRTSQRPHSIKKRDEISSAAAKGGRKKGEK